MRSTIHACRAPGLVLALCFALTAAYAQPMQVDPAFAPRLLNDAPVNEAPLLIPLADSTLLALGNVNSPYNRVNSTAAANFTHLQADGAVDPAFASTFARPVDLFAPLRDGRIIVVTQARASLAATDVKIERLLADGSVDPTYTPISIPDSRFVRRMVIQPDGRILVIGLLSSPVDGRSVALLRLGTDGTLDPTFDTSGANLSPFQLADTGLAVLPDGRVLYNDAYESQNDSTGSIQYRLARLNADGTPDTTFGGRTNGDGTPTPYYKYSFQALALQSDGKILAANDQNFLRFNADGSPDTTFAPVIPHLRRVDRIVVLSDDRILVQAHVSPIPYDSSAPATPTLGGAAPMPLTPTSVFLLGSDGALIRDFSTSLPEAPSVELLAAQPDGHVIVRYGAAYLSDGYPFTSVPLPLPPLIPVEPNPGVPMAQSSSGPLSSTSVIVVSQQVFLYRPSIARIDLSGTIASAFALTFSNRRPASVVRTFIDTSGRLLVAGNFTSIDGTDCLGLARFAADGALDASYQPALQRNVSFDLAFAYPDGRLILQEQALGNINGDGVSPLVTAFERINADGSVDPGFRGAGLPAADPFIHTVDASDNLIVSGLEADESGNATLKLVRLNPDGTRAATLPTTFTYPPSEVVTVEPTNTLPPQSLYGDGMIVQSHLFSQVEGVQVEADGKLLIAANVEQINGVPVPGIARLNADGSTDTTYRPPALSGSTLAQAVSLLPGGRALLPGAVYYGRGSNAWTVRLLADGSIDQTFTPLPNTAFPPCFELSNGMLLSLDGMHRWLADGLPDLNYNVALDSDGSSLTAAESTGTIYLGGRFATVNGLPRASLARFVPVATEGFTHQPQSVTIVARNDVVFQAAIGSPDPATYQWTFDGTPIAGETSPALVLHNVGAAQAGDYAVIVTVDAQTLTSDSATLTILPSTARLVNFSARSRVSPDRPPQIGGFVIRGGGVRPVLLRAVGYGLGSMLPFDSLLPDPTLRLYDGHTKVAEDTGSILVPDIVALSRRLGAFSPSPSASPWFSYGSALAMPLAPGPHTAHTVAGDGQPGISLFEVYDAGTNDSAAFANISIRGQAASGNDVLIAGFVIGGNGPLRMLIRGIGPGLVPLGVTDAIADPRLTLYNAGTRLAANDDWDAAPALGASDGAAIAAAGTRTGAFPLAAGSHDAALLVTLPPGAYTVLGSGAADTSGEMMIELYVVDP